MLQLLLVTVMLFLLKNPCVLYYDSQDLSLRTGTDALYSQMQGAQLAGFLKI